MTTATNHDGLTIWRKLIAGSNTRKTRLHDERGGRAPFGRLARNMPRAFLTGILRVAAGVRPARPWISYDAQSALARFLSPVSQVVEFGSGMSTLWYARRAGHVTSIEDDNGWFEAIRDQLAKQTNVDYRFVGSRTEYIKCVPDEKFDLIMIDGNWRDDCAYFAVEHLAPGGIIYLDNSDMGISSTTGDMPAARRFLLDFAIERRLQAREFTDFAPAQFHAQRGLMIGGPT